MAAEQSESSGIIVDFYDNDTGMIREDGSGNEYDFVQHGAQVTFFKNEQVIFISVKTPSGNTIIKNVVKGQGVQNG